MSGPYYVGVDVGTGSVRAGLFNSAGKLIECATKDISTLNPRIDFYEQSSDEIWNSCCFCIQSVVKNVSASDVHGVGFDATCSLVVLDGNFHSVAVSDTGDDRYNIVLWMDHRAKTQAEYINSTNHNVLKYTGGKMSLEMQPPKLLWLKHNLGEDRWKKINHFFDLPDFLTWKATGSLSRSLCSLVCKWGYQADETGRGWDESFYNLIGLSDLLQDNCHKIGVAVSWPGQSCGGLSEDVAQLLGLKPGTPVATSIIDAHAGGLGLLGCRPRIVDQSGDRNVTLTSVLASLPITSRLALICGTSTCHMIMSETAIFVGGVWGPYYSAMVPQYWLNEGGQSATGKLLDHILMTHPAYGSLKAEADKRQFHIFLVLEDLLISVMKREGINSVAELTRDFHIQPDYHGNRSPIADPTLRGMVSGLSLSAGAEDLAIQYLATVQALAYGTREIIEVMRTSGHTISMVYICGGLSKNRLFVQTHADILDLLDKTLLSWFMGNNDNKTSVCLPVVLPDNQESVLLGSAILGAVASQDFSDMQAAMTSMAGEGSVISPNVKDMRYHEQKYRVHQMMRKHQLEYRQIMNDTI